MLLAAAFVRRRSAGQRWLLLVFAAAAVLWLLVATAFGGTWRQTRDLYSEEGLAIVDLGRQRARSSFACFGGLIRDGEGSIAAVYQHIKATAALFGGHRIVRFS